MKTGIRPKAKNISTRHSVNNEMALTVAEILNGLVEPISSRPVAPMTEAQGRGKLSQEALALYNAYAKAYGA